MDDLGNSYTAQENARRRQKKELERHPLFPKRDPSQKPEYSMGCLLASLAIPASIFLLAAQLGYQIKEAYIFNHANGKLAAHVLPLGYLLALTAAYVHGKYLQSVYKERTTPPENICYTTFLSLFYYGVLIGLVATAITIYKLFN